MFAARSKTSDFVRPYIITTSDRPGEFFHLSLGQSMSDIAVRFEAYCVSGAQGWYHLCLVTFNIDKYI